MIEELTPRARIPLRIVATREDEAKEDRRGLCRILVVEALTVQWKRDGRHVRQTDKVRKPRPGWLMGSYQDESGTIEKILLYTPGDQRSRRVCVCIHVVPWNGERIGSHGFRIPDRRHIDG